MASVSPSDVSVAQKIARYALIGALVMLGAWMLQRFLPALCWAVVLAIGTSSLYDRWLAKFQSCRFCGYCWAFWVESNRSGWLAYFSAPP
jgi:predicted PurR-regulated permease PerM